MPAVCRPSSRLAPPVPARDFLPRSTPATGAAVAPGITEVAIYPTGTAGDHQALPMPHRRATFSLIILAFAAFVFSCNEGSVMGLISVIAEDMNRSEAAVGLMTTVFALVNMAASIPLALALKRLPRRVVLSGTAAVLAVGLLLVATAPSFGWLLAGRGVTAFGHAAFWAIVTPTVAGLFSSGERGKSVSRLLIGGSAAGIVGIPLITWVGTHAGWRLPYAVLTGVAVVLALAIFLVMPSFRAEHGTAARGLYPSWRIFVRVLAVCGLCVMSTALTWTFITPFATEVAGMSHAAVPTLLLLGGVAGSVAMVLVGRYLDRFPVLSVAIGLAILGSVWALMAVLGSLPAVLVACVVAQGFGWSVLVAAMVNWAIRHAPGSTDTANGTYATVFGAGNAAGSVLGAGLLAAVGAAWLPVASLVLVGVASVLVWTVRAVHLRKPYNLRTYA